MTATAKSGYKLDPVAGWTMNEDGTATMTVKFDAVFVAGQGDIGVHAQIDVAALLQGQVLAHQARAGA